MSKEHTTNVVNALSDLISTSLHSLESERTMPRLHADASDDLIKHHTERVESLRELREMFENEMARQPNPGV